MQTMEQVLCYLCPHCPNEFTNYSLQRSLDLLNQHICRRHHRDQRLSSADGLRRLLCVQTGPNGSFATPPVAEILGSNFRCRSLFEQRSMILEQTMAEDELTLSAAQMYALFPPPKDNANIQGCTAMLLQGEKNSRNSWADFLRHSMALDEKGCASSRAWVPVHTTTTVNHYAATMAAFAFFATNYQHLNIHFQCQCQIFFSKLFASPKGA